MQTNFLNNRRKIRNLYTLFRNEMLSRFREIFVVVRFLVAPCITIMSRTCQVSLWEQFPAAAAAAVSAADGVTSGQSV